MFQEFREKKEREIAELVAIKNDLELRLQMVGGGEEGDQGESGGGLLGERLAPLELTLILCTVCECKVT